MMRKNFQQVTNWLLIHEGGFVNNPNDPGGATNKGITQRVYDGYRRKKSLPLQSVALMSDVECWEIYEEQYWNPIIGDELPSGLDYALYDFAVNSGPSRAVRFLQEILGVTVDGIMGNATLGAIASYDACGLVNQLCEKRLTWMKTLNTWKHFGRGWTVRIQGDFSGAQPDTDHGVLDRSFKLINGAENILAPTKARPGKALEGDEKVSTKIKQGINADSAMKIGIGAVPGAVGALTSVPEGPLQYAFAGLIILGGITVALLVYHRLSK
jgi:lysozyme family protein